MSLTIISTPYNDINGELVDARPLHQRWIFRASSDNFGNDGFRYVIEIISDAGSPSINEIQYIPADPDGELTVDIYEVLRNRFQYELSGEDVHFITSPADENHVGNIAITLAEAWLIDGVMVINEADPVALGEIFVFDGAYDGAHGPYPPVSTFKTLATSGISSRILSDRKADTHVWSMAKTYNLNPSECIFIPVRQNDYGVGYFFQALLSTVTFVKYRLVDADGNDTTEMIDIGAASKHAAYPFYPANLNNGTFVANKPTDYPGWRYYSMQLIGEDEETPCSAEYVFYPVLENCDHENIRIAWKGHRGGWDYFNFQLKNTFERQVQRSQFQRGFSRADFSGQTRRTYDRYPIVERFLTCATDYLVNNEKDFLKWILQSTDVRIVRDNGTSIPVTVETGGITGITRAEPQQLEQFELKLKYAGDDLNWNGWWIDESEVEGVNPLLTRFSVDFETNETRPLKIQLATDTGTGTARVIAPGVNETGSVTTTLGTITFPSTDTDNASGIQFIDVIDESTAPTKIVKFKIDGDNIVGFEQFILSVNEFSDVLTTIDIRNFPNLTTIATLPSGVNNLVVLSCALTVAQVNKILTTLDANGLSDGIVEISGQTPAAAPTGAGAAAVTSLEAKGWIVSTD